MSKVTIVGSSSSSDQLLIGVLARVKKQHYSRYHKQYQRNPNKLPQRTDIDGILTFS